MYVTVKNGDTRHSNEITLTLPTECKNELLAEAFVRQIAEPNGFTGEQIEEIETALREACINAIEHSEAKEMSISITFFPKKNCLTIIVEDDGIGIQPDNIKHPVLREKMKSTNKRGWGLMLIGKLMDEIDFDSSYPHGTRLIMKKYLAGKKISSEKNMIL